MSALSDKKISFGRYLLQRRQACGLSAEALAAELKISANLLYAIENEDFVNLPSAVYTRGFLSAYAGVVGADRDWVLQDYLNAWSCIDKLQQSDEATLKAGGRFWRRLGLVMMVLLGVIIVTVLISGVWQTPSSVSPSSVSTDEKHTTAASNNDSVTEEGDIRSSEAEILPKINQEDDIRLSIRTVEETWIKIIIDNKTTREYTLQPGDRLEMEASNGYNLLIGNATGVRLTANRIPIAVPGRRGEVVNIEIP